MHIGILETGVPPGDLGARFGSYADMMVTLLGPGFTTETFAAQDGVLPAGPEGFDGFLVTGSPAGVYDDLPWIGPLAQFLRDVRGRTRLVGICFGHQIIAHAFGGTVVKSDRGWGLGRHDYAVGDGAEIAGAASLGILVSHQDQVVVPPPDATIVAGSDFTPFAMLAYGGDAISCQGHPEFEPAFARALLESREARLPPDVVRTAFTTVDDPGDRDVIAGWIRGYLSKPGRSAAQA